MTESERYADKIAKLLRKAESTTQEEAELLVQKAQELMTQYAISEELISRAKGENAKKREEIIEKTINLTGQYRNELWDIGATCARNNDCRVLIGRGSTVTLYVIGFESEVRPAGWPFPRLEIPQLGARTRY